MSSTTVPLDEQNQLPQLKTSYYALKASNKNETVFSFIVMTYLNENPLNLL